MTNEVLSQQTIKRSILKSTTLLGGSSFITIIIGMVRVKFIAILIGPSGVGFMGVLTGLREMISIITGFGLSSSGVRQIASAVAKDDNTSIAITVKVLQLLMWFTGIVGMLVMMGGSFFWSTISFKTTKHTFAIAFLALSVLFTAISSGQSTILQGFRRIADVAKINIIGAMSGAFIGLPCYYFWGIDGVVPSLVLASISMLATSWWFAHKIKLSNVEVSIKKVATETKSLFKFGMPLMLSGLVGNLTMYVIRVYLTRVAGLDVVGYYQAAFSLAGVLVGFVLGAMGTDYYPRLTAVADDNEKINLEVNTQTEVALLLAVPALSATVVFMPLIVNIFYSSRFAPAISILQWAIFGVLGRVISWPLSFIMLAKAKGFLFLLTELIGGCFHCIAVIICYKYIGLPGSGLGFALLYLMYTFLMLFISDKIANVHWSISNLKLIVLSICIISLMSILQYLTLSALIKYGVGLLIFILVLFSFLSKLAKNSGLNPFSIFNRILFLK